MDDESASPNVTPRPSISIVPPDLDNHGSANSNSSLFGKRDLETPAPALTSSITPTGGNAQPPRTHKPIGIVNEQNTCFLNSTFQALSASLPLISLLTSSPSSSLNPLSSIPAPISDPALVPCLNPLSLEPPLYDLLPVTRAFVNNLHKSWSMKDAGGGTFGSKETTPGRFMSLRTLLRELARKYDQYDDYRQQDSHELLRHLLDSMEMEEKDVIKRLQPAALKMSDKKRRKDMMGSSPVVSPLPSPAHSLPGSPVRQTSLDPMMRAIPGTTGGMGIEEIPDNERMIPFVDILFGGTLASVVVCERCKSVSHTYEGFLDISLSMKGDEPRARKRDKIMSLFRPKANNATKPNVAETLAHQASSTAIASDEELSESERPHSAVIANARSRRKSLDIDDKKDSGGIARAGSLKNLVKAPTFSFGKKKKDSTGSGHSRPGSSGSGIPAPPTPSSSAPSETERSEKELVISTHSSSASIANSPASLKPINPHIHGPGPTPAQAAYIRRILASGSTEPDPNDPLTKLKAANAGEGLAVNDKDKDKNAKDDKNAEKMPPVPDFGLLDSLKLFTSVEVLEGENSFACKKCWKIKSGKFASNEPHIKEEDEDGLSPGSPAVLAQRRATVPSISLYSDTSSMEPELILPSPVDSSRNLHRDPSLSSNRSSASQLRAPSPLRRSIATPESPSSETAFSSRTETISSSSELSRTSSKGTAEGTDILEENEDDSDGLSDTSSDEEPPKPSEILPPAGGRRPKNTRRVSTHFVMRRAFKRYLIAKPPEILVFHLKRFKQSQKTGLTFSTFYDLKKIDDYVPFPEIFDLAPFIAPNRNDYKLAPTPIGMRAPYMDWRHQDLGPELDPVLYQLYAIVVHLGTMIGGHYIAYTLIDPDKMFQDGAKVVESMKNMSISANGEINGNEIPQSEGRRRERIWCYCSDTSIRPASLDEVLKAKAYLCFYEKVR